MIVLTGQFDHLLVGHQVELIKHGVMLGQVLVLVLLLLAGKDGAVDWKQKNRENSTN